MDAKNVTKTTKVARISRQPTSNLSRYQQEARNLRDKETEDASKLSATLASCEKFNDALQKFSDLYAAHQILKAQYRADHNIDQ